LSRCAGFSVETPDGHLIGFVTGSRFGSRIDRPDQLEIAHGHLHQRELLIPVELVESIASDQEIVVLNCDPRPRREWMHRLVIRARKKPAQPLQRTIDQRP
jgi:hypothetical protein